MKINFSTSTKVIIYMVIWAIIWGVICSIIVSKGDGFLAGSLNFDLGGLVLVAGAIISQAPISVGLFYLVLIIFRLVRGYSSK